MTEKIVTSSIISRRQSYQSILNSENEDLVPSAPATASQVNHGFSRRRRFVALLVVLSISLLVTLPRIIPTMQELEMANRYDMSMWTAAFRIRQAQSMADAGLGFLSAAGKTDDVDMAVDGALRKINEKNGAKHYMETPDGCESSVVILRHCEKGQIREHCDYLGYERSVYIASLFGDDEERWPAPSYIFAEGPGQRRNAKKMNFREVETVGPLSKKTGVPVDDSYSVETANHLATQLMTYLQTGQMCGKLTLIAWKHSNIGHLARHLGCGPNQGCPIDYKGKTFDDAWQIKYTYRTKQHSDKKDLSLDDKPRWEVYGGVIAEGFDPLAFSKQAGDYPFGGTDHGARWEKIKVDYPERTNKHGTAGWSETRLGFANGKDEKHKHHGQ